MKRNLFFLSFFTLSVGPLLAEQIPYVYTGGGNIYTDLSRCVSTAKKDMRLGNFTRNLVIVYDEDNSHSATLRSEHSYKPVSITYRCMTNLNTWTFGIGAIDEEEAWNAYDYFLKKITGVTKNLIL